MNQSSASKISCSSDDVKAEARESNPFVTNSFQRSLALRFELQKLQANHKVRIHMKDILRVALKRPLVQAADRRLARVSESDVLFFRFIFLRLFEVNPELAWCNKPRRFTADGWRRTYHAEIREQTGLSKSELRRKIPRFVSLGLIETDHLRRENSLQLKGMFIRPNPAKVMELLNALPATKKAQKKNHHAPHYRDPLAGIGVVHDGPITPRWLREREIARRLLYFSNFRSVLPTAIRYHKTKAAKRRALRDKRLAIVPEGLIRFALTLMTKIFGVDELGRLLDWPDLFDTDGNRIMSVPELMKETGCTRREVREAVAFYQQQGIYRGFFKKGAKYTGARHGVPRIPWVSWSFSKFAAFLQFPGSQLEFDDGPLRYVLLDPDEPRRPRGKAEGDADSSNDHEVRAVQLEIRSLSDIDAHDKSDRFSTSFSPSSLNAIDAQAILVYIENRKEDRQLNIANGSGQQIEREKPASPAFSLFLEKDSIGHCPQVTALNPVKDRIANQEQPNSDSGAAPAPVNGHSSMRVGGHNSHFPNGRQPGSLNPGNHTASRRALPWEPDVTVPGDCYDWAISAHQGLMERDSAALVIKAPPAELVACEEQLKREGQLISGRCPLPRRFFNVQGMASATRLRHTRKSGAGRNLEL